MTHLRTNNKILNEYYFAGWWQRWRSGTGLTDSRCRLTEILYGSQSAFCAVVRSVAESASSRDGRWLLFSLSLHWSSKRYNEIQALQITAEDGSQPPPKWGTSAVVSGWIRLQLVQYAQPCSHMETAICVNSQEGWPLTVDLL